MKGVATCCDMKGVATCMKGVAIYAVTCRVWLCPVT